MSRTEQTLEDLKSYLRSHSKIREQRSHMSKVSTMATFIGQPMNSRLPTGSLGLLECRWSLPGLRKLRQDGGRLLAGAGPLLEGQHIPGTHCVRGPAVLASHQSRPVCHRKRRQDRAHLGHTSWKMRIGDEHQGGEYQHCLVARWQNDRRGQQGGSDHLYRHTHEQDSRGGAVQLRGQRDIVEQHQRPVLPNQRTRLHAYPQLSQSRAPDDPEGPSRQLHLH